MDIIVGRLNPHVGSDRVPVSNIKQKGITGDKIKKRIKIKSHDIDFLGQTTRPYLILTFTRA